MDEVTGRRGVGDQVVLLVAGVLMFAGAQLHPRASLGLSFRAVEHATLSDDDWRPVHLVILLCLVALAAGLVWMLRRGRLDRTAQRFGVVMLAGTLVLLPEMVVHTFMNSEADAVGAGASAPMFDIHLVLQAIGTPIFGVGVVGLAVAAGRRRLWGGPLLMVLGVIGGVAFGASGLVVVLHPAAWDMLLFIGLVPLSLWLVLSSATALWRSRRLSPRTAPASR